MRADVQKILSRVGSLPPLPDIVLKLQERLRDPEVSLSELSTLVMKDPAFTADILRIANSPFYGLSRPTSSLASHSTYCSTLRNSCTRISPRTSRPADPASLRDFAPHSSCLVAA